MIEYTNKIYLQKGWALVDKVPTPWNVRYNKKKKISQAFPEKKGTVDFVGVSHGKSVAFDAKNTKERTRFPLANVDQHQVNYLIQHQDQGGKSFFIVHFEKMQETFFVPIDDFNVWWVSAGEGGRKSIPYTFFNLECDRIYPTNGVPVDYLKCIS